MAAITVCEKLVAAFSSANVSAELSLQLKALVPGAVHLSLHVAERQHNVVLASGNLLRPGLLTSTLHSLHESLVSLGLSPKLWHINQKPVLVPKEMLSVARATSCSVFLTLPLAEGTAASREVGPHGAFGFMMVAFPAREHLSSQAAKACIALALALSASCQLQLQQQCRMVANCLLLGNYHGEEPAAALMGGGASGAPGHTDAYALEDCEEDLGDERWELGSGEFGEDGELVADQEDGPGGSSSYHGHHTLRPGDFSDGGLGSGSSGGASSLGGLRHRSRASELAPRHDGLDGLPASLVMDPLTLTFASPSAERAFQAHYTNNLLEGDLLTCLVSCVLLAVRVLSPGYTFTARHCLQYLVGMAPLPLLFCARQWYCRHRDSLLWILRLYGICYIHVRIGQYLGPATGLGVPKLAFAYGWLLLHSITWQLRFSHHLPVTVLAHALNIALLWRSSCPVGVPPMQPALECGLLAVLIGTLCVLPAVLLVYYKERRARRVFAAFFPYWEPEVAARIRSHYGALGGWPGPDKLPLVYNSIYNIGFMGLENLHPFDSKKYSKVLSLLEASGCLASSQVVQAREATHDMLLDVHDAAYLEAINTSSAKVAQVTELGPLALLPAALLRSKVLKPMRFMAGGTMLAAALAQERGWAINLGGGLHHAYHADGGGWCVYDDIYLAIRKLRQAAGGLVKTCMVIDLDVHQGNGYERDKLHFGDQDTYLVDVYNGWIYPRDETAKKAINVRVELLGGAGDETYLAAVRQALEQAFRECPRPDLVIYNAGTDILAGDPLGSLSVSAAGVLQRDELVWRAALAAGSPLVMLLSGGYTAASTPCIASSMTNLFQKLGLGGTGAGQREAAVGQVPATAAASEL